MLEVCHLSRLRQFSQSSKICLALVAASVTGVRRDRARINKIMLDPPKARKFDCCPFLSPTKHFTILNATSTRREEIIESRSSEEDDACLIKNASLSLRARNCVNHRITSLVAAAVQHKTVLIHEREFRSLEQKGR